MADVDNFIGKNVDDFRQVMNAFRRRQIAALEVGMTVKVITGLCHLQEPVDGF